MDTCWRLAICVMLVATCPLAIVAQVTGPKDTMVLNGGTAVINCSFTAVSSGIFWLKDGTIIAGRDGILDTYKDNYPGFYVILSSPTGATTQLDLVIPNAQVSYEGSYQCQIAGQGDATAELKVEIQGDEPTIAQTPTGSLTEGIQGELTCTATGYRPPVSLAWYRNGNLIQTGVTETQSAEKADGTTDTTSVWTFTPARDFNEDTIECRTDATNRIGPSQTGTLQLNVTFAPVVEVKYSNKVVKCSADSNPSANSYEIIFNETVVRETYSTSGRSYSFTPDSCTRITCNVTNAIGTGVGEVSGNPICPGYVDPTTANPTTSNDDATKPPGKVTGLKPGVLAAIIVGVVVVVAPLVVISLVICYVKRLYCFASNKTKNGGSTTPPRKQPSVVNTDMIRNQPEVRQSVHKYEDEPKKPRIPRNTNPAGSDAAGRRPPSPKAARPSANNDRQQRSPQDTHDGTAQGGKLTYSELEFKDQGKNGRHQPVHPPSEEPTQYASILV